MSNLQIGLAIAGGLVLAAVVAHGAWSAHKNRPKLATPDAPDAEPSIQQASDKVAERQEPRFDADAGAAGLSRSGAAVTAGPTAETNADSTADTALDIELDIALLPALEKKPGLDALIDVITPVAIDSEISGEAALAAMPATRRVGSKPFAVECLNIATGHWELPAAGQRYSACQCGVQLANRLGALNQIEYSEFVMKTQGFADAIGGEPDFPEMGDEVARARELDQFASEHDAQLSFTLRALSTAWSPGYVAQNAARAGFVAGAMPGRMVLPATVRGGAPLLGLAFDTQAAMSEDPEQTALREITLSLDVPQVPREEQPFARLRESAAALAISMGAVVMDDNGNRIAPQAMDVIGTELEQLYDRLDERDLSAGSVLARRLFS